MLVVHGRRSEMAPLFGSVAAEAKFSNSSNERGESMRPLIHGSAIRRAQVCPRCVLGQVVAHRIESTDPKTA